MVNFTSQTNTQQTPVQKRASDAKTSKNRLFKQIKPIKNIFSKTHKSCANMRNQTSKTSLNSINTPQNIRNHDACTFKTTTKYNTRQFIESIEKEVTIDLSKIKSNTNKDRKVLLTKIIENITQRDAELGKYIKLDNLETADPNKEYKVKIKYEPLRGALNYANKQNDNADDFIKKLKDGNLSLDSNTKATLKAHKNRIKHTLKYLKDTGVAGSEDTLKKTRDNIFKLQDALTAFDTANHADQTLRSDWNNLKNLINRNASDVQIDSAISQLTNKANKLDNKRNQNDFTKSLLDPSCKGYRKLIETAETVKSFKKGIQTAEMEINALHKHVNIYKNTNIKCEVDPDVIKQLNKKLGQLTAMKQNLSGYGIELNITKDKIEILKNMTNSLPIDFQTIINHTVDTFNEIFKSTTKEDKATILKQKHDDLKKIGNNIGGIDGIRIKSEHAQAILNKLTEQNSTQNIKRLLFLVHPDKNSEAKEDATLAFQILGNLKQKALQ